MILHQEQHFVGDLECPGVERESEFTMAFQPIVNAADRTVFGHEALVRGRHHESAAEIFGQVPPRSRYRFDQRCRIKALQLATRLGAPGFLCLNLLPNAIARAEACLETTLEVAERLGFPIGRIVFELTENEKIADVKRLREVVEEHRCRGFQLALDDFGAGYSGLALLAELQVDIVKVDMNLVRGIDRSPSRRAIVKGLVRICEDLGAEVIAEGIETHEELSALRSLGIELFQGYHFARPAFEALATRPRRGLRRPAERADISAHRRIRLGTAVDRRRVPRVPRGGRGDVCPLRVPDGV